MRPITLLLTCLILLISSAAWAGEIHGLVKSEQDAEPIPAAKVSLKGKDLAVTTGEDGKFAFTDLPAGSYTVIITVEGYATFRKTLPVPAEGVVNLEASLKYEASYEGSEVVVTDRAPVDQSPQTSAEHFTRDEIAKNAGALEDVTKAIQQLPGIVSNTDFTSDMYVRGSESYENLIVLDHQLLANPYHFGVGLSVLNTDLIKDFTFYAAGFPAQYPFATGSVLDVTYRDGNRDHVDGDVNVSMISASAQVSGPAGKQVTWIASGRRSYFDYMLRMLNWKDIPVPVFSDVLGRVTWEPNDKHRLVALALRSEDGAKASVGENPTSVDDASVFYSSVSQVYGLDYTFLPNTWFLADTTFSYQIINANGNVNSASDQFFGRAEASGMYVNEDLQFKVPRNVFKFGGVYGRVNLEIDSFFPLQQIVPGARFANEQETFNISFTDTKPKQLYGFYVQHEAEVIPSRLRTNLGVRFDHYEATKQGWLPSPRASLATNLAADTVLKFAWGIYYLPPYNSFATDEILGNPNLRAEKSTHYVVGLEQGLGANMKLRVESFYKEFDDLVFMDLSGQSLELSDSVSLLINNELPNINWTNSGYGNAYGIETFFQKKMSDWWDGWLAYTLAEVRYNDGMGMYGWYYPMQDQRHTLALVANIRPIPDWVFSASFRLASGKPYTPVVGWEEMFPGTFMRYWQAESGPINSARFPLYHRLDLRVEKTWHVHKRIDLATYAEVYNVYNQRNIWGYWYENEDGLEKPKRKVIYQLPFLPFLGVRADFL